MIQNFELIFMLTHPSLRNRLIACIAAGGFCLAGANQATASECGCEATCAVCPTDSVECSCGCSSKKKHNGVYRALDAVAGGIEKLFGLNKRGNQSNDCDALLCDDACDAAMLDELMLPLPVMTHDHSQHTHAYPEQHYSTPLPPAIQPAPSYADPSHGLQPAPTIPTPALTVEPQILPPKIPTLKLKPTEGSLFDTLSNPFGDDEARVRIPRPVRPTSYQRPSSERPSNEQGLLRPIRRIPLSQSYTKSNRRMHNAR